MQDPECGGVFFDQERKEEFNKKVHERRLEFPLLT